MPIIPPTTEHIVKSKRISKDEINEWTEKDGVRDGPFIRWFGSIKTLEASYKNGLKHGKVVRKYKSGSKKDIYTFKDGKIEGEYILYWNNGNCWVLCMLKDGVKDGPYCEFNDYGKLSLSCTYKDGELEGNCREFIDGKLFSHRVYKNGKLV